MNNEQNEVAIFNEKQRQALFNIVKQLKIQSPIFFVGSWNEDEFTVQNYNEEYIRSSENIFLNYYWCEYKAENNDYKISMFYKDFDIGSGNLHILPGAVQVWSKTACDHTEQGFCINDIEKCKRNNKGEIEYKMHGGKSGHYMKYALLKFESSEESVYYKTIFVPEYGFFTKYDGIKVDYEPGKKVNKCGPNYYCEKLKRWIFVDNQYLKGEQTNGTKR